MDQCMVNSHSIFSYVILQILKKKKKKYSTYNRPTTRLNVLIMCITITLTAELAHIHYLVVPRFLDITEPNVLPI